MLLSHGYRPSGRHPTCATCRVLPRKQPRPCIDHVGAGAQPRSSHAQHLTPSLAWNIRVNWVNQAFHLFDLSLKDFVS